MHASLLFYITNEIIKKSKNINHTIYYMHVDVDGSGS